MFSPWVLQFLLWNNYSIWNSMENMCTWNSRITLPMFKEPSLVHLVNCSSIVSTCVFLLGFLSVFSLMFAIRFEFEGCDSIQNDIVDLSTHDRANEIVGKTRFSPSIASIDDFTWKDRVQFSSMSLNCIYKLTLSKPRHINRFLWNAECYLTVVDVASFSITWNTGSPSSETCNCGGKKSSSCWKDSELRRVQTMSEFQLMSYARQQRPFFESVDWRYLFCSFYCIFIMLTDTWQICKHSDWWQKINYRNLLLLFALMFWFQMIYEATTAMVSQTCSGRYRMIFQH